VQWLINAGLAPERYITSQGVLWMSGEMVGCISGSAVLYQRLRVTPASAIKADASNACRA
jgi:hypothetical protein